MPSTAPEARIAVAVGVIVDGQGRVLMARRKAGADHAGKWEFPGGKIHAGESSLAALARELSEELGITLGHARPLITLRHDYPGKNVLLEVWRVTAYRGEPEAREGQTLAWAAPAELDRYDLLAANRPIQHAVQLPSMYAITDGARYDAATMLAKLEQALAAGIHLVQLRARHLSAAAYLEYATAAVALCRRYGAQALLNADPGLVAECGADGVHLSAARLRGLSERPLVEGKWVAASCHDAAELAHAARIGADFVVLSPVQPTRSHPGAPALGWEGFRALCVRANRPVYALGGMQAGDLARAWAAGGQGVAVVSALWDAPSIPEAVAQLQS